MFVFSCCWIAKCLYGIVPVPTRDAQRVCTRLGSFIELATEVILGTHVAERQVSKFQNLETRQLIRKNCLATMRQPVLMTFDRLVGRRIEEPRLNAQSHNTSRMFRTIGLLPVCTGLRGSTAFSAVHVDGAGAFQSCPLRSSLIVSSDEAGLMSSPIGGSTWKGFCVNSAARGDIRVSSSSATCESDGFTSLDWISVWSWRKLRC